jgi:hypothetical protein
MNSMTGSYSDSSRGGQVKAVGDLDLGVLQPLGKGLQGGGGDDVATLERDELAGGDRRDGGQPRPSIPLAAPLRAFGVM